MNINLRFYRTYRWMNVSPAFGGRQLVLQATDELQYEKEPDVWVPVPIVEGPVPAHPDEVRWQQQQVEQAEIVNNILERFNATGQIGPVGADKLGPGACP